MRGLYCGSHRWAALTVCDLVLELGLARPASGATLLGGRMLAADAWSCRRRVVTLLSLLDSGPNDGERWPMLARLDQLGDGFVGVFVVELEEQPVPSVDGG
jgi:hypothetical protein